MLAKDIKNEAELFALGASLLGYLLTGKGVVRAGEDTITSGLEQVSIFNVASSFN